MTRAELAGLPRVEARVSDHGTQAPWRLIIPGETRASRWVRQVTALVVKKG